MGLHKLSSGGFRRSWELPNFPSSKKLVQKASCFPEGCDRWQDHRAGLGWLTPVERPQGAGSRALEIILVLLQLLILAIPHPSKLWILEVAEPRGMFFFFAPERANLFDFSKATMSLGISSLLHCTLFSSVHWCLTQSNFLTWVWCWLTNGNARVTSTSL